MKSFMILLFTLVCLVASSPTRTARDAKDVKDVPSDATASSSPGPLGWMTGSAKAFLTPGAGVKMIQGLLNSSLPDLGGMSGITNPFAGNVFYINNTCEDCLLHLNGSLF